MTWKKGKKDPLKDVLSQARIELKYILVIHMVLCLRSTTKTEAHKQGNTILAIAEQLLALHQDLLCFSICTTNPFPAPCFSGEQAGWARSWEGMQPGQLTQTNQRNIPHHILSCSAIKPWFCFGGFLCFTFFPLLSKLFLSPPISFLAFDLPVLSPILLQGSE